MSHSVGLRRANLDDSRSVWEWRNDPHTRAMSRTTDEVSWELHQAWFAKTLADPDRTIWIGEAGGARVGMVRVDHGPETEISINLAPEHRGRGLGRQLLVAALKQAPGPLVAGIRPENTASIVLFEQAGFKRDGAKDGLLRYRRD